MGMPSAVLMERAALACFERLSAGDFDLTRCVCICGSGNNGGDGIAVARLLHLAGRDAHIVLLSDPARLSADAAQQLAIAQNYGVTVAPYSPGALAAIKPSTIIDALFGVGLSRTVEGDYRLAIEEANAQSQAGCRILSVDIPSGIATDTGEVLGAAISANATVTFAFNKLGLTRNAGKPAAGELTIADIGIYANADE
jgi:NAD(P)H-hydrate epimerase